jgi:hypothetical protein
MTVVAGAAATDELLARLLQLARLVSSLARLVVCKWSVIRQ